MVRFEKEKIIVEINSRFPAEEWLNIYSAILQLTMNVTQENITQDNYNIGMFLQEFLPDADIADRMAK